MYKISFLVILQDRVWAGVIDTTNASSSEACVCGEICLSAALLHISTSKYEVLAQGISFVGRMIAAKQEPADPFHFEPESSDSMARMVIPVALVYYWISRSIDTLSCSESESDASMIRTAIPATLANRQDGEPFKTDAFCPEWQTTTPSAKNKQSKQTNR
jgi:hypothetical protein